MLSSVSVNVNDNRGGVGSGVGTGVHAKVGVAGVASSSPIAIRRGMKDEQVRELLGNSPLAEACIESLEWGAALIYCMPVTATTAGTISAAARVGDGAGKITAAGSPVNDFQIIVKVVEPGARNVATITVSEDGGYSWGDEQTVPLSGTIALPNTGVVLSFDVSETKTLAAGDTYTFTATAPVASNADILDAVQALKTYRGAFEMIHVVGTTNASLWASLEAELKNWEDDGRPVLAMVEQRNAAASETAAAYVDAIQTQAASVRGRHVAVCRAWASYVQKDGRETQRNLAAVLLGLLAQAPESTSIAFVRDYNIPEGKITRLLPEGIENYLEVLDAARYIEVRTYPGKDGYFVANTNTTADAASDYANIEVCRVMYRLVRETNARALEHQNEDFDQSDPEVALKGVEADLNVPVEDALEDGIISAGEAVILFDQMGDGMDKKMPVEIRFVPRGYIREIILDFSVVNALA